MNRQDDEARKGRTPLKCEAEGEIRAKQKGLRKRMQEQEAHVEDILTALPLSDIRA